MALSVPEIAAGDLLIAVVGQDGAGTFTWPGSWAELVDLGAGTVASLHIAYLIASGGEKTVVPTSTLSERSSHLVLRIAAAAWHGTTPPEVTTATGTSATPDPPSLTPSWGSADTLWIASFVIDDPAVSLPVTGWPTSYSGNQVSCGSGDTSTAGIAIATRGLAATTEDPGSFSTTASDNWAAATIAVRPAS